MSSYKNVALVGASGSVGRSVLNGLLSSPTDFKITILVREGSTSKITQEGHAAIKVLRGDFNDDSFLKGTLEGQDALVISLDVTPDTLILQNRLVDVAAAVGVKRIIPSEYGSDTTNPKILEAVPIFQGKVDAVKHLESIAAKSPATSWTAIVNGPFLDWGMERNVFGFNPSKRTATLYDSGTTKFDSINITSLGAVVSGILTKPDSFKNRYAFVSDFTISQNDIFEALLKTTRTSREDWKITHRITQDLQKEGFEKIGKGDFSGALDLIFAALFRAGLGSDYSATHKLDNVTVGLAQTADLVATVETVLGRK
ncbi:conserved hypothetical protein [Talaromyces stipitatus ATCC 10500]|uniref:NmrA-like domain-containing protein n=1 Tax=Talaromyces stipitatus (strain ATCC 10500 / CBS 375.48 / QM 6759 / NRRL 1006) TaxID=441959 RepID=B8MCF8_TALSN|nr:uncharacterized protein TSTA_124930 [Talaromyces stipitatus ATCC 10500]EED18774.1 conserved hypothetical protein [Talaromyces stipitatus ATCC 10500]